MTKFKNELVYACPGCWLAMKKSEGIRHCEKCRMVFGFYEVFDSKAEHARGYGELKPLEAAGVITGLRHHEIFELVPALYLSRYISSSICIDDKLRKSSLFITTENTEKYPAECKIYPIMKWESDFTYQIETLHKHFKGEIIVEEVKRLGKKEITQTFIDAKTGDKHKQKIKIDFPHFVSDEDFRHFRKICQLMLLIHGHRVQVRAGGQLWMFNAKWELERVSR